MSNLRRRWAELTGPFREHMSRIPLLAYQVGLLVAIFIEQWLGTDFARNILEFRKIPKFFGIVDIFEPFADLDFTGILAPFFPPPTAEIVPPLPAAGQAIVQLIETFWQSLFYQGTRDPGFFSVVFRVLVYDIVIFVIPTLLVAWALQGPIRAWLKRAPRWAASS